VNQELLHLLDQISREKGIDKPVLVEAVLSAVLSAARKRMGPMENLQARLDDVSGAITLFSPKRVVLEDDIIDDSVEISLEEAEIITPTADLGQTVDVIHELEDYGRIAAQTAKQVIIQKVREAERETIYHEFIGRQGELVNGVVARVEREGNLVVDLGRTEALLPRREQSFRETFKRNDRIRAYIIEVKRSSSGPQVILSRTHPGFLMRLFEMEVPEIYENIVEIKEAARDASGRAKIAVMSNDKDVDPVGACVGIKGMRVQSVVQELRGEKIDIIPWIEDQVQFVRNALSPAKVARVYMNDDEKTMQVVVPNDQLSLAIGKRGQNVRLAAKLTHWKIDIMSEDEADADTERLEALRRAQSAFSQPKRLVPTEATQALVDEAVTLETADEAIIATESAEMPETLSEDTSEAVEDVMNTAADTERSEDEVDAAVMEATVASEGSAPSSELAVSELPTEGLEEEPVDEDDPERSDERET
jgi:N utilization substance protein A